MLLTAVVLAISCFDDAKLEDLSPPTIAEHFILVISSEPDSGGDGPSPIRIAFVGPDTWEIWNDESYFHSS